MTEINVFDSEGKRFYKLMQWDKNVYLYIKEQNITDAHFVHFFNSKCEQALVVSSTYENGTLKVKIPNILIEEPLPIIGYVFSEDGDRGQSTHGFKILVRQKPKPSDYLSSGNSDYLSAASILTECKRYADIIDNSILSMQESENNAKLSAQSAAENASAANESMLIAKESEESAIAAKDGAIACKNSAFESERKASASKDAAAISESNTEQDRIRAEEAAQMAEKARIDADASAFNASTSESNTAEYEKNAAISAETAKNAELEAIEAKESAIASVTISEQNKNAAETSALEASAHAASAKKSADSINANEINERLNVLEDAVNNGVGDAGEDGITFIPHIDANGELSWTNTGNLENPAPINIIGKDGLPGSNGKDGITPHIGDNGNWFAGETDTGKPSRGEVGPQGDPGIYFGSGEPPATALVQVDPSGDAVLEAVTKTACTLTLAASGWSAGIQSLSAAGVRTDSDLIVAPAPESFLAYGQAQVRCTGQAAGQLRFACGAAPGEDLRVNILILN